MTQLKDADIKTVLIDGNMTDIKSDMNIGFALDSLTHRILLFKFKTNTIIRVRLLKPKQIIWVNKQTNNSTCMLIISTILVGYRGTDNISYAGMYKLGNMASDYPTSKYLQMPKGVFI